MIMSEKEEDYNITSMYLAISNDRTEEIHRLLQTGDDINVRLMLDYTPICLACQLGHWYSFATLLEYGPDLHVRTDNKATLLHLTVDGGNYRILDYLLTKSNFAQSGDINACTVNGETALFVAISRNRTNMARLLLEHGACANVVCRRYTGFKDIETEVTALLVAVQNDNLNAVKMLLNAGADPQPEVKDYFSPLHFACFNGSMKMVKFLLTLGVDYNAANTENENALHYALQNGHRDVSRLLLSLDRIRYDSKSHLGYTPLHVACEIGCGEMVASLLERGANINERGFVGMTPLHFAAKNDRYEVTRLLLANGADVRIRNIENWTLLHTAAFCRSSMRTIRLLMDNGCDRDVDARTKDGRTVLHMAVGNDYSEALRYFVAEKGAAINVADEFNWTPVHYAAFECKLEPLRFLLCRDDGVNVNARTNLGSTPLHIATEENHPEVVEQLLDHAADVNATQLNRWTPLHFAVFNGYEDIVIMLLQRGADVNATESRYQRTALHMAVQNGNVKLINALLDYGADFSARMHQSLSAVHQTAILQNSADAIKVLVKNGAYVDGKVQLADRILGPLELTKNQPDGPVAKYLKLCEDFFGAIKAGNVATVQRCLSDGVYVNCRSVRYKTPLIYASWKGHTKVVELLLRSGADPAISVEERNVTALHYAAKCNRPLVMMCLLKYGAVFNAGRRQRNATPLDLARKEGSLEAINLLENIERLFDDVGNATRSADFEAFLKRVKRKNRDEYYAFTRMRHDENGKTLMELKFPNRFRTVNNR